MVAAYATSDRQPLPRGRDVGRILRYCQTRNRSNTSRGTFRYAAYAFVFPITRQTRAGSERTNSRPPVSSLLRDRSSRRNSRWCRPFDCSEEHWPRRQRSSTRRVGPDSRESYRLEITTAGGEIQAICPPDGITRFTLRQTVERDGGAASLPEVDIHDWPAVAYRDHDDRHASGPSAHTGTKRSGNLIFSHAGKRRSTSSIAKAPSSWTVIRC